MLRIYAVLAHTIRSQCDRTRKPKESAKNNIQLHLSIGLPTLTVVVAWLFNGSDTNRLNNKVDRPAASMRAEIISIRNDQHKDNLAPMGYMVPLHERMAKLEGRN